MTTRPALLRLIRATPYVTMLALGFLSIACSTTERPRTVTSSSVAVADATPAVETPPAIVAPGDRSDPGPIEEVAYDSRPWRFAGDDGMILLTPHYEIHTTVRESVVIRRLPLFFERALYHYRTSLASLPEPPGKFETYLFRNRSQWRLKTREVLPDQAATFMRLGRGGFATRGVAVLYQIDYRRGISRDTLAIAAHEGWHQYTQKTFQHQLPVWLEEGIATYMEGYRSMDERGPVFTPTRNRERYYELRSAYRDDALIPMHDLLTRTPQELLADGKSTLLTYYAQVWALTRFLVEGEEGKYADGLTSALQDAAEGRLVGRLLSAKARHSDRSRRGRTDTRSGPWLIYAYFTDDLVAFREEYERYVEELVSTRRQR